MLEWIAAFLGTVWEVFWRALVLDPELLAVAQTAPPGMASAVVGTIVFLAGASQLLGQRVVLFVNRVKTRRFVLSLMLNGALFLAGLLLWALILWLAVQAIGFQSSFGLVARMIGLGSAPLIFSFFVLVPYAGPLIGRALSVWSFLATLGVLRYTFQTDLGTALLIVGAGWLAVAVLTALAGDPIRRLRRWLFRRVTGSRLDATASDLLRSIPGADALPPGGPARP